MNIRHQRFNVGRNQLESVRLAVKVAVGADRSAPRDMYVDPDRLISLASHEPAPSCSKTPSHERGLYRVFGKALPLERACHSERHLCHSDERRYHLERPLCHSEHPPVILSEAKNPPLERLLRIPRGVYPEESKGSE